MATPPAPGAPQAFPRQGRLAPLLRVLSACIRNASDGGRLRTTLLFAEHKPFPLRCITVLRPVRASLFERATNPASVLNPNGSSFLTLREIRHPGQKPPLITTTLQAKVLRRTAWRLDRHIETEMV